jgi:hypothetical protein
VLEALYCSAPGVTVVGLLQARGERKRGFQVPGVVVEDVVGELESGGGRDGGAVRGAGRGGGMAGGGS